MCPIVSGIISNILNAVNDDGTVYPSGKVNQSIFQAIPLLNGMIGSCFSGNAAQGCIFPEISGSIYQGILELYVAKELTKGSLYSSSRSYNLTSFKEGDSSVTVSDASKNLGFLLNHLSKEFDTMLHLAKYTLASQNPSAIIGTDASPETSLPYIGYYPYVNYRAYEG